MPVVSVLMVFHRDTPFLRPAIASVLGQTLRDIELVLVDNGVGLSPAELGEAGADPRLVWVRMGRNEGIAAGHNAGVQAARGEFVALLDYDDLALPRRLELQVTRLRARPGLALVSARAESIDAAGVILGAEFAVANAERHREYSQYAAPFFTPACLGRREVFLALPYRADFTYCADFDFVTRLLDSHPTELLPEVLLQYRRHGAQTTTAYAARIEMERAAVRLLTARRRAGRSEGSERLPIPAIEFPPAASCAWFSRQCRREGFHLLAAYHARRILAARRSPGLGCRAVAAFLSAWWQAPAAERAPMTRLFLKGPVRMLGIPPAENNSAGPTAG